MITYKKVSTLEFELLERIVTLHWDLAACPCVICNYAGTIGCSPQSKYLPHRKDYQAALTGSNSKLIND